MRRSPGDCALASLAIADRTPQADLGAAPAHRRQHQRHRDGRAHGDEDRAAGGTWRSTPMRRAMLTSRARAG
jgi:hypothetical protein